MDGQLSFDVHQNGSEAVVSVRGEVDLATASQLEECLGNHLDRDVVVNLADVAFLDSSGMSVLVRAANAAAEAGHSLRTVNEQDNVWEALEAAGLLARFHVNEFARPPRRRDDAAPDEGLARLAPDLTAGS